MSLLKVKNEILERFEELSPASNVAVAVLEYVNREDIGAADIAIIASADPVLTAKIMRLANSAYYGMSGRISQLNVAISMLGLLTVRSLAVAAVIEKVGGVSEEDWRHSIETAIATTMLAPRLGAEQGPSFSAGMLHDLGMTLLNDADPTGYEPIRAIVASGLTEESEKAYKQAEFERYGILHTTLAATILRNWNFPEDICNAIAYHHDPESFKSPLQRTLRAGDRLAHLAHCDLEEFGGRVLMPEGVDIDELPSLLEAVNVKVEDIINLFG